VMMTVIMPIVFFSMEFNWDRGALSL
jgi:hypothetical protein